MFTHSPVNLGYADLSSITTEKERTYATPNGTSYPSITTVLSILSKDSIAKWKERVGIEEANKISTRASKRGTAVHEAIEQYLNNEDWEKLKEAITPDIIESVLNVRGILDSKIGVIYAQEAPLYSDHLGVAGRVDCIAEYEGKLSVIDFKTSRKPKRRNYIESYFCQEAAYAIMWEERTGMPISNLVTIISVDDMYGAPGNQVFIEQRDNWVPKLLDTISLYKSST